MDKVVKKVIVFIVCLISFTNTQVLALSYNDNIINNNDITITKIQYNNLLNLGFTDTEIMNMSTKEFDENKNLEGKIVTQSILYFDEQNNILNNRYLPNDNISLFGLQTGYIETTGKKMTTTIVSVNNKYRYKVTLEWKNIPSTRSYDIIGIGTDTNVKIDSGIYFQQNFCYSSNNCSSSIVSTIKSTSTGATSTFQLPSSTIVSLNSYLYFDVSKNTTSTITQLNAYGDYSHATSNISKSNANNHSINRGGISLDSSISNYYDNMTTAKATWTGSW